MLCSRCKKRPAVVFITRMEGDKPVNDGICLTCAKELGIKPVDDLLQKFGITDDDMEQMDQQLGALMNPEENEVYFQISFYLPDTDETIYTSKLIKPGQHLYEITLEKAMEPGEYPLTVKYDTFTADEDMTPRNGAEVNCTLVVKE